MNKEQIENVLNNIGDFMGSIRRADRKHNDLITTLSEKIVSELKSLSAAGVSRKVVLAQMLIWNTNTEDGSEIRSVKTINRWLRDAGFRARAERSDIGTVKSKAETETETETKAETKAEAILRIKALMLQHGIAAEELA